MNKAIKDAAAELQSQASALHEELDTLRQAIHVVAQTGEAMDLARSDSGRQCLIVIAKAESTITQLEMLTQGVRELSQKIQDIE